MARPPEPSPQVPGAGRQDGDAASSSAHGLPLRLSLLDPTGIAPVPSSPVCQDSVAETMQLQSLIQLSAASLPLTRRITLHSFSRWGCARDAGAGAGLTYAIELSRKLTLVFAAGAAVFPQTRTGLLIRSGVRTDLQWTTKDGKKRSLGLDAVQLIRSAAKQGAKRRIGASISGSF